MLTGNPVWEGFCRVLDDGPWTQLAVMADWLDEKDEPALAEAYRWMGANMIAPMRFGAMWHWRNYHQSLALQHELPLDVLDCMLKLPDRIGLTSRESFTISAAYHRAALAIVQSGYLSQQGTKP